MVPATWHKWTRAALTPTSISRYSIYLPRRDGRLSWPKWLGTILRSRTYQQAVTSLPAAHSQEKCRPLLLAVKLLVTTFIVYNSSYKTLLMVKWAEMFKGLDVEASSGSSWKFSSRWGVTEMMLSAKSLSCCKDVFTRVSCSTEGLFTLATAAAGDDVEAAAVRCSCERVLTEAEN